MDGVPDIQEYGVRTVLKLTAADIRKVPWLCSKYVPFQPHNRQTQGPWMDEWTPSPLLSVRATLRFTF